jgi:hypothetical protein
MADGIKLRVVHVIDRGVWYAEGAVVNLVKTTATPPTFHLVEHIRGAYEVHSCKRSTIDQDDLLQVELRPLHPE